MTKQSKTINPTDFTYNNQNEVISVKNPNQADWKKLSKDKKLSEDFIIKNADFFDWNSISANQNVTFKIMATFPKKIKWDKIATNPNISADAQLLAKYKGNISKLVQKENLSEEFIRKHEVFWNWSNIVDSQKLSEKYIREIIKKIEQINLDKTTQLNIWWNIFKQQQVSEQFLRNFEEQTLNCIPTIAAKKDSHTLSDQFVEDFKYILSPENVKRTQKNNLSKAFFQKYQDFTLEDFYRNTTEEWIEAYPYKNRLRWYHIATYTSLSEDFMLKYWEKLREYTRYIGQNQKYSEDFVRKIADKLLYKEDLTNLITNKDFSQTLLEEYIDKINLSDHLISYSTIIRNLSEDFLRKYQDQWDWRGIGCIGKFSEGFLREFEYKWDWNWNIASCQQVSEDFLREFKDRFSKLGWQQISEKQKLSEAFIREFEKNLDWEYLSKYQTLSPSFREEFKDRIR